MSAMAFDLLPVFGLGLALGAAYLAALWLMVQRLLARQAGGYWLLGSMVLRAGLLVAAWFWIVEGDWRRLAACLLGFIAARLVATRWLAAAGLKPTAAS